MISPIDIRQHSFGKAMRGYNTEDVRAFLQSLSAEWEQVLDENKRLKSELERSQERLKSFTDMEDIMRKTLYQAEQSSKAALEAAARDAQLQLAEAAQKAKQIIAQAELERQKEENKIQELLEKKATLVGQLKAFLKTELEEISHYEENLIRRTQAAGANVEAVKAAAQAPVATVRTQPVAVQPPAPVQEAPAATRPEAPELPLSTPHKPAQKVAEKELSFFDKVTAAQGKSAIISQLTEDL